MGGVRYGIYYYFQQYLRYIGAVSFIGGEPWSSETELYTFYYP